MSKYPDNWEEIRERVLLRAGGKKDDPRVGASCEWCRVRNYAVGYRDADGKFHYAKGNIYYDELQYAGSYQEAKELADHCNEWCDQEPKYIVIVLTIAHLKDPNPHNVEMDNLAALCQRCHNRYDNEMRMGNAKRTNRRKKIEAGQLELL